MNERLKIPYILLGIFLFIYSISVNKLNALEFNIVSFDEPFRASSHSVVSESLIFEVYDERCRNATGHATKLANSEAVRNLDKFSVPVKIFDLSYLRCPGWANEWELGVISMGDGGNEWAVIIGNKFIVRVRALFLEFKVLSDEQLMLSATVHPIYCEHKKAICVKNFQLLRTN